MQYNKKSVEDIDVSGKKVIARCDFNVPQDENGNITDDKRIRASLETIKYLLDHNAAVILCSHLGRPKGEVNMKYSLAPVAKRLSELLGQEVKLAKDVVGEDAKKLAAEVKPGEAILLENVRFEAYTFSKAQGGSIGTSLCEEDKMDLALGLIKKAEDKGVKLLLPVDTVCGDHFGADAEPVVYEAGKLPDNMMGMDIGPKTVELFSDAVKNAGTVVWNGPMGVFEFDTFAVGTKEVAKAIAASGAVSIIGGGDSAAAVEKLGFADKMTHISTGGGASLEFLEGLELPGIACLQDK